MQIPLKRQKAEILAALAWAEQHGFEHYKRDCQVRLDEITYLEERRLRATEERKLK